MSTEQKKILVVEDEEDIRNMLIDAMVGEGYLAIGAGDGEEGLATALGEHPDLIMLDIRMPKLDGTGMLKQLRLDAWGKDAQVMVLTNFEPSDELIAEFAATTPVYFLLKADVDLTSIISRVKFLLEGVK